VKIEIDCARIFAASRIQLVLFRLLYRFLAIIWRVNSPNPSPALYHWSITDPRACSPRGGCASVTSLPSSLSLSLSLSLSIYLSLSLFVWLSVRQQRDQIPLKVPLGRALLEGDPSGSDNEIESWRVERKQSRQQMWASILNLFCQNTVDVYRWYAFMGDDARESEESANNEERRAEVSPPRWETQFNAARASRRSQKREESDSSCSLGRQGEQGDSRWSSSSSYSLPYRARFNTQRSIRH